MISWSKVPPSNPLSKILGRIPFSETLIDPILLDDIQMTLLDCGYRNIPNSIVMLLLLDMAKAELVTLEQFTWPSTLGKAFIIKET